MSNIVQTIGALTILVLIASPAFALNPQPLPPGILKMNKSGAFEPPDPCIRAHAACRIAR